MPSTFSALLRLELQADGENDSVWGQIANQQFVLLENAIAGRTELNLIGGTYVLTTNDGAADDARKHILYIDGDLGSAQEIIVPANTSKTYVVTNATNPALPQTLTVKTAAGTGVAVPQGKTVHLLVDFNNNVRMAGDFVDQLSANALQVGETSTPRIEFYGGSGTPFFSAGGMNYYARNTANANYLYGAAEARVTDNTSGSETSQFQVLVSNSGALDRGIQLGPDDFSPFSDNTMSLGRAARRWTAVFAVTATIQTSDERLKRNVNECPLGTNFLLDIDPISFDRVEGDGKCGYGFSAQQVEAVLAAHGCQDTEVVIAPANGGGYGMRYESLIAPLVKGFQEMAARVSALEQAATPGR